MSKEQFINKKANIKKKATTLTESQNTTTKKPMRKGVNLDFKLNSMPLTVPQEERNKLQSSSDFIKNIINKNINNYFKLNVNDTEIRSLLTEYRLADIEGILNVHNIHLLVPPGTVFFKFLSLTKDGSTFLDKILLKHSLMFSRLIILHKSKSLIEDENTLALIKNEISSYLAITTNHLPFNSLPLNNKKNSSHIKEPLNPTLVEIVTDYNEFSKLIINQINSNSVTDPDKSVKRLHTLSALLLRVRRFRLKFLVILFMTEGMQFSNAAISKKINDLLVDLKDRTVTLNFNNPPISKGPTITIESTINLVAKALTKAETAIKELLPPLILCHNIKLSKNIFTDNFMQGAIHDIAPKGFQGVQGDYYYVFHLLALPEPFAAFDEVQKTQWNSYFIELNYLFHFYTLTDIPFDFSVFINNNQHLINLPYTAFIEQTTLSKNTFSRLIHALNDFVLIAWSQLILQRQAHFARAMTNTSQE